MVSVGSVVVDDNACGLFSHPFSGTIDNLRAMLADLLGEEEVDRAKAEIKSAMATSKQKGVSKEKLTKIWIIDEDLTEGALEKSTQLCKHHADNSLFRQFSTNDRMVRYKHLKSVFFMDTLLFIDYEINSREHTCSGVCERQRVHSRVPNEIPI